MNNYIDTYWYRTNPTNFTPVNNPSLYGPKEGYEKGNLFANLYSQYKNYQPATLKAKNERENKLYELSAISFAAHELNLYLDLHPNDQSMITLFNDYRIKANELIKEYEKLYGPLTISSNTLDSNVFAWEKDPWPWEVNNV